MKNLKRIALGLALLLGTSSAFATGNIHINSYLKTDYSIVSIVNSLESNLTMKIYDNSGNLYYSKKVDATTTTQKLFDFSFLADGTYKITLTGKQERIEKAFKVNNNKLVTELAQKNTEKTIFRAVKDAFYLTYLSINNTNFKISIRDRDENEFFINSYAAKPTFSRKFNVEALPKGDYKVRLVSDNKEYNYAFRK